MTTTAAGPVQGFRGRFLLEEDVPRTYREAAGPFVLPPAGLAVPEDTADVARLVEWAAAEGRALVPRGGATGMPGHNVGRGVVVDLSSLDRIEPIDPGARTVRVGAGAVAAEVDARASELGLRLPPLPSSADRCTLGGMVANNAAGARSFLHGAIREWVLELEVVLADGSPAVLGRAEALPAAMAGLHRSLVDDLGAEPGGWPDVRKNSSGYALDHFLPTRDGAQLVVGSEGTLALVTSILLRLAPAPARRGVALVAVADLDHLPALTRMAEEIGASACEYLDRTILEMARLDRVAELGELARGMEALLLVETEGDAEHVRDGLERIGRLGRRLSGRAPVVALDPERMEMLWEVRHRASPTIRKAAERGLRSTQFIEDCVVPRPSLPAFVRGVRRILGDAGTRAVVFGHAGDGNLHVNPLIDRTAEGWRDRVREILEGTVELVSGLGGTLSGEHGDGRVRAPFLEPIWGPRLAGAFRRVKEELDPEGVLNPGVVVPLPGQDPLEGLLPEGSS